MKKSVLIIGIIISISCLTGCSLNEFVNQKVEDAKKDVSSQIQSTVENAVNEKVDNAVKSVESTLDPKLKQIRDNMANVKEMASIYYRINKKMPIQNKIEPLFPQNFAAMKIGYKLSGDGQKAIISYIGSEYSKEKVPDITVEGASK